MLRILLGCPCILSLWYLNLAGLSKDTLHLSQWNFPLRWISLCCTSLWCDTNPLPHHSHIALLKCTLMCLLSRKKLVNVWVHKWQDRTPSFAFKLYTIMPFPESLLNFVACSIVRCFLTSSTLENGESQSLHLSSEMSTLMVFFPFFSKPFSMSSRSGTVCWLVCSKSVSNSGCIWSQ